MVLRYIGRPSVLRLYKLCPVSKKQCTTLFILSAVVVVLMIELGSVSSDQKSKVGYAKVLITNVTSWSIADILQQPFASNIIVSERNRFIYCPIPKAASTNWKYIIRKLEGVADYGSLHTAHNRNTSGMRYLSDYSPTEAHMLLTNSDYFKFTFVRDPYMRLLSCYMDKFRNSDPNYTETEYRTFVAAAFSWRYARRSDLLSAPRPSFRSFVHAISTASLASMNEHWRPQTLLCGFGIMPYDFVGRMEQVQRDTRTVLQRIGFADESFPTQNDLGFPPSGASTSLALNLYTTDLIFATRAIYTMDFEALGYD